MGDDAACSINDLPKVTSIMSSESISKTEVFNMMVRFLSKHQFRYTSSSIHNHVSSQQQQQLDIEQSSPRLGQVYHFWEDLYHVTETLADNKAESLLYSQQQETLRKLRLVAAPLHTDILNENTSAMKHEMDGKDNEKAAMKIKDVQASTKVLVKEEEAAAAIKEEGENEQQNQQRRKSAKKEKKEKKKKDKKRKREE